MIARHHQDKGEYHCLHEGLPVERKGVVPSIRSLQEGQSDYTVIAAWCRSFPQDDFRHGENLLLTWHVASVLSLLVDELTRLLLLSIVIFHEK